MEAHELLAEIYRTHSVKELAAQEGLSPATLYKWAETGESHRLNPLEHIVRLYHQTRERRLLDWIAERTGGKYVRPEPKPKPAAKGLPAADCPARRQLDGLSAAVAAELSAPWLPPKPAAHWRRQWQALRADTERRLARCGRGCEARQPCRLCARAFALAAYLQAAAGA